MKRAFVVATLGFLDRTGYRRRQLYNPLTKSKTCSSIRGGGEIITRTNDMDVLVTCREESHRNRQTARVGGVLYPDMDKITSLWHVPVERIARLRLQGRVEGAARGQRVELEVVNVASPKEAAQLYPSNYWFAQYTPPSKEQLPATFTSREEWLGEMKSTVSSAINSGIEMSAD